MSTTLPRRWKPVIGTLAHNRMFTMREIDQYTRFDLEPINGLKLVKQLIKLGWLSRIENSDGPNTYFPTQEGWTEIERDLS